eukprot:gene1964-3814_t
MNSMFLNQNERTPLSNRSLLASQSPDNDLDRLEKQNFDLKLKTFYLEDRIRKTSPSTNMLGIDYDELKIENASLRLLIEEKNIELEQRNALLFKAKNAIQSLKQELARYRLRDLSERDAGPDFEPTIRNEIPLGYADDSESSQEIEKHLSILENQANTLKSAVNTKDNMILLKDEKLLQLQKMFDNERALATSIKTDKDRLESVQNELHNQITSLRLELTQTGNLIQSLKSSQNKISLESERIREEDSKFQKRLIEDYETKIRKLQQQHNQALLAVHEQYETKVSALSISHSDEVNAILRKEEEKYVNSWDSLGSTNLQLQQRLEQYRDEIQSLCRKNTKLLQEVNELKIIRNEVQRADKEGKNLSETLMDTLSQLHSANERERNVQRELDDTRWREKAMTTELEDLRSSMKTTTANSEQVARTISDLQLQLQREQERGQKLQIELDDLRSLYTVTSSKSELSSHSLLDTQLQLQRCQDREQRLQNELDDLRSLYTVTSSKLELSSHALTDTQLQLQRSQDREQRLQIELDDLRSLVKMTSSKSEVSFQSLTEVQLQLQRSQDGEERLRKEVDDLRSLLTTTTTKLELSSHTLTDTQLQLQRSQDREQRLQNELDDLRSMIKVTTSTAQEREQRIQIELDSLRSIATKSELSSYSLTETQLQLQRAEEREQRLHKDLDDLRSLFTTTTTKFEVSSNSLTETQLQLQRSQERESSLQKDLDEVRSLLATSTSKLQHETKSLLDTQLQLQHAQEREDDSQRELEDLRSVMIRSTSKSEQTSLRLSDTLSQLQLSNEREQKLHKEIEELRAALSRSVAQAELSSQKVMDSITQLQSCTDREQRLQHQVEDLTLTTSSQVMQIEQTSTKLIETLSQLHSCKDKEERLQREIEEDLRPLITKLTLQYEQSSIKLMDTLAQLQSVTEREKSVQKEYEEQSSEIVTLKSQSEQISSLLSTAKASLQERDHMLSYLKSEISQFKEENATLHFQCDELNKELYDKSHQLNATSEHLQQLQIEHKKTVTSLESYTNKQVEVEDKYTSLVAEIQNEKSKNQNIVKELSEEKSSLSSSKMELHRVCSLLLTSLFEWDLQLGKWTDFNSNSNSDVNSSNWIDNNNNTINDINDSYDRRYSQISKTTSPLRWQRENSDNSSRGSGSGVGMSGTVIDINYSNTTFSENSRTDRDTNVMSIAISELLPTAIVSVERLRNKITKLRRLKSDFESQIQSLSVSTQEEMSVIQDKASTIFRRLSVALADIDELKGTVEKDRKRRDRDIKDMAIYREEMLSSQSYSLKEYEERIRSLTETLSQERSLLSTSEKECSILKRQISDLQDQCVAHRSQINALSTTENKLSILTPKLHNVTTAYEEAMTDIHAYQQRIASLEVEKESYLNTIDALDRQLKIRIESIEILEKKVSVLESTQIPPDLLLTLRNTQGILRRSSGSPYDRRGINSSSGSSDMNSKFIKKSYSDKKLNNGTNTSNTSIGTRKTSPERNYSNRNNNNSSNNNRESDVSPIRQRVKDNQEGIMHSALSEMQELTSATHGLLNRSGKMLQEFDKKPSVSNSNSNSSNGREHQKQHQTREYGELYPSVMTSSPSTSTYTRPSHISSDNTQTSSSNHSRSQTNINPSVSQERIYFPPRRDVILNSSDRDHYHRDSRDDIRSPSQSHSQSPSRSTSSPLSPSTIMMSHNNSINNNNNIGRSRKDLTTAASAAAAADISAIRFEGSPTANYITSSNHPSLSYTAFLSPSSTTTIMSSNNSSPQSTRHAVDTNPTNRASDYDRNNMSNSAATANATRTNLMNDYQTGTPSMVRMNTNTAAATATTPSSSSTASSSVTKRVHYPPDNYTRGEYSNSSSHNNGDTRDNSMSRGDSNTNGNGNGGVVIIGGNILNPRLNKLGEDLKELTAHLDSFEAKTLLRRGGGTGSGSNSNSNSNDK